MFTNMKKAYRIEIIKKNLNKNSTNSKSNADPIKFSFTLLREDLTIQETNAIVNAANGELHLGSGVAGAIKLKGGFKIQEECYEILRIENKNKSLKNGDVAYTKVGKFQNKNLDYIFHAVGPMYFNGERNEKAELTNCFLNCFKLADKLKLKSLAIPPISTGIFGYPKREGAKVFYNCVERYFHEFLNGNEIKKEKEEEKENIIRPHEDDDLFCEEKTVRINPANVYQKKFDDSDSLYFNEEETNIKDDNEKNIKNNLENNSIYIHPDQTNKQENEKSKDELYENINEEVIKKKIYKDINKFEGIIPNNNCQKISFSEGSTGLSNLHINENGNNHETPDFKEKDSIKTESEVNHQKKEKDENKNIFNKAPQNKNLNFDSNNREGFSDYKIDKDIDVINEKSKSSRIIRNTYDENSKIELENSTLNDINMVIIDKITHEIFFDILKEKLKHWRNNEDYEFNVTEC